MAKCSSNLHEVKPALLMVLVQTVYSLVNICYKLSANDGMNLSVLVGYRFLFGAAFILPLAFFAERKKRPKLTRKIALYGFLCGLFGGSLGQNLYLKGLVLTSATFASAMTNLIPAITFVVAISLRLERLAWNTAAGKAKVLGTMVGIGGAMALTFYKGVELDLWNTNINLLETTSTHRHRSGLAPHNEYGGRRYVLGAVLSLASCLCYSLWLIIQAKAAELYPCPYSITAMMAVAASFQGVAFALCGERDWSQWNLGWNIRLLTVAFSGIIGSGLMFSLVAWCVRTRGPLFVSIFQPLMLVMVALGGSLFLEEKLHLGTVIGAIFIVGGLYIVLWGKRKEMKTSELATANTENEEHINIQPPPPPPQNGISHSNRGSRGEEEVVVEVQEEEAHMDILPPPPPQNGSSHSNRGSGAEDEVEAEVEAYIDILPPPPPQNGSSHSNRGSGAEEEEVEAEVEEEEEGYIDILSPPPPQNGSSRSHRGSRAEEEVEAEVGEEAQIDLLPPPPPQNGSSPSCCDSRVEARGRIDLSSPLQTQNDKIHSSSGGGAEMEARIDLLRPLQSGSSGSSMKEVEVEVEVEAETRISTSSSHSRNGSSRSSRDIRKDVEMEVDEREEEKPICHP